MEWESPGGAQQQSGRNFAVRLSEWFARRTGSPRSALAVVSSTNGKPPRAGRGERSKPIGFAAERRRLARDYRPGYGWQSLALTAVLIVVGLAVFVPTEILDRIIHGPPRIAVARPDVLVVSGSPSDGAAVSQTVQPRGYSVRAAANVESGLEDLRREPGRIGLVMIDMNLAGAKRMISAVKTTCPDARLILLNGPRGAARISNLLIDAGMD